MEKQEIVKGVAAYKQDIIAIWRLLKLRPNTPFVSLERLFISHDGINRQYKNSKGDWVSRVAKIPARGISGDTFILTSGMEWGSDKIKLLGYMVAAGWVRQDIVNDEGMLSAADDPRKDL